ncbi:MAG: M12 family metallo-peptidase [Pirellulales bacterium]
MALLIAVAWGLGWGGMRTRAAVVVLSNRASEPVRCEVAGLSGPQAYTIARGDLVCVSVSGQQESQIAFASDGKAVGYHLDANACYYFFDTSLGGINLQKIGYSDAADPPPLAEAPATQWEIAGKQLPGLAKIPVKILVDDEERMVAKAWQERLRKRVEAASAIFERICRIRFEVVAYDTWDSDDRISDFNRSMVEFEAEVPPAPARLVIGFTSQYSPMNGQTKVGGTRAAFYPYVLVREWSQHYTEAERLEMLVHELGHYLGAVHSPETTSVMRPVLGDRQARLRSFRIGLDPLNALAIHLVGEEYRIRGNVRRLIELSPVTRLQLRSIYQEIGRAIPNDPAPPQYISLLGNLPTPRRHTGMRAVLPESAGGDVPATNSGGSVLLRPTRATDR